MKREDGSVRSHLTTNKRVSAETGMRGRTKTCPTNDILQLLPAMRDELFVRLGKRYTINIGQIEGQRVAIGTWNCLLRIIHGLRHDARWKRVDKGRVGRGLFSRLYGSEPKWNSKGTLPKADGAKARPCKTACVVHRDHHSVLVLGSLPASLAH